ncbi:MAG: phenylacetate--CoA ligase, partial [Archaeoglobi archaeon]|nr:phenylacetate--CoA ligase [Candidatus Mnemosynella bozhongmuii]
PEVGEHFQIIVDRKGALDEMTVMVEVKKEYFSDRISDLMEIERKIEEALKNALNLRVNVELVEHGTIPRTSGKAKKVIDRREI